MAAALVLGGCTSENSSVGTTTSPAGSGLATSGRIPQPSLGKLNDRTRHRLAPESERVDLVVPSFSHPTRITNPLFPIANLRSAVLVGKLEGKPWRAETTLLPSTKVVEWHGQSVETLQSQFVAYLDGRIFEVAVDHYAEADDGSVWYFGEDAFTYEHGRVADTEGTWLAGVQGPPAMIMPAHPQVGDVYRTENVPGLVFEQVTIKKIGETVNGPTGAVHGAIVGQELHMDERRLEEKTFAPGYGEFFSGGGRTFEANALAVPADASSKSTPGQLKVLCSGAMGVLGAARAGHWTAASTALAKVKTAWDGFRTGEVPKRLAVQMTEAIGRLSRAVVAGSSRNAPLAAVHVAQACLDFELRYRLPAEVDLARFDLWTRQLQADAADRDRAAVVGDVAALEWIRKRIALGTSDAGRVDHQIRLLRAAAKGGQLRQAATTAIRLRKTFAEVKPTP